MNIFVLDKSPIISAQMQCDKHIETTHVHYGQGMMEQTIIGYGNMAWSYALNIPEGITRYINVSKLSWTYH
jgi:hypothetical protein